MIQELSVYHEQGSLFSFWTKKRSFHKAKFSFSYSSYCHFHTLYPLNYYYNLYRTKSGKGQKHNMRCILLNTTGSVRFYQTILYVWNGSSATVMINIMKIWTSWWLGGGGLLVVGAPILLPIYICDVKYSSYYTYYHHLVW